MTITTIGGYGLMAGAGLMPSSARQQHVPLFLRDIENWVQARPLARRCPTVRQGPLSSRLERRMSRIQKRTHSTFIVHSATLLTVMLEYHCCSAVACGMSHCHSPVLHVISCVKYDHMTRNCWWLAVMWAAAGNRQAPTQITFRTSKQRRWLQSSLEASG